MVKTLPPEQQDLTKAIVTKKSNDAAPAGIAARLNNLAHRGATASLYPPTAWPNASNNADDATENVADLTYDELTPPDIGITVNDSQCYPIYGFVKLYWQ